MGLRILGGSMKGRRLPPAPAGVRPTGARQREALFAIWRAAIEDARMLDLFAGSGIMGLEALSRGAQSVTFVDGAGRVVRQLERFIDDLRSSDHQIGATIVHRGRLPTWLASGPVASFDLIFADPPYVFEDWPALIRAADPWLAKDGELAIEHSVRSDLPPVIGSLERFDQRVWGESAVSRYQGPL